MEALGLERVAGMLDPASGEAPMLHFDTGTQFMKSSIGMEGGRRVIYMEASNEARDIQSERILAAALEDSRDYFLKFGRIDLDHATMTNLIRDLKLDPGNPFGKEIGRPIDVQVTRDSGDIPRVWVKAAIFSSRDKGNQVTKAADWFWDTLNCQPPFQWFPSVAGTLYMDGAYKDKDPDGRAVRVMRRLRWHSIGLSRTPVNTAVREVSTVPLREFAKALRGTTDIRTILSQLSLNPDKVLPASMTDPVKTSEGQAPLLGVPDLSQAMAATIEEVIVAQAAVPNSTIEDYLSAVRTKGIPAQVGLAYLMAILDSGRQLSIGSETPGLRP